MIIAKAIRPYVPLIRQTPHGRRIATKVNDLLGQVSAKSSGHVTPHEGVHSMQPMMASHNAPPPPPPSSLVPIASATNPASVSASGVASSNDFYGSNFGDASGGVAVNIASPQPRRMSNTPLPSQLQATLNMANFGRSGNADGPEFI